MERKDWLKNILNHLIHVRERGGSEDSKHTSLTEYSEIKMTLAQMFQAFLDHILQCR